MTKYAETNAAKTSIVRFPISLREAFELFPPNTSPVDNPSAGTFAAVPVVLVEETSQPTLAFGESATLGVINDAGTWREQWTITPANIVTVKAQLRQMARSLLAGRITDDLHPAEIEIFAELARLEQAGASPVLTRYPLIQAVQAFRGGTFTQAATFVQGFRDSWKTAQVVQVLPRYLDVIARIQAASTAAEAKAIYDELEALA